MARSTTVEAFERLLQAMSGQGSRRLVAMISKVATRKSHTPAIPLPQRKTPIYYIVVTILVSITPIYNPTYEMPGAGYVSAVMWLYSHLGRNGITLCPRPPET